MAFTIGRYGLGNLELQLGQADGDVLRHRMRFIFVILGAVSRPDTASASGR